MPTGLVVSVAEELPKLAVRGRERLGVQVSSARAVGELVVRLGGQELRRISARVPPAAPAATVRHLRLRGRSPNQARCPSRSEWRRLSRRHRLATRPIPCPPPRRPAPRQRLRPRPPRSERGRPARWPTGRATATCRQSPPSPFRRSTRCRPRRSSNASMASAARSWYRSGPTRPRRAGVAPSSTVSISCSRSAPETAWPRRQSIGGRKGNRGVDVEAVRAATDGDGNRLTELAGEMIAATAGQRGAAEVAAPGWDDRSASTCGGGCPGQIWPDIEPGSGPSTAWCAPSPWPTSKNATAIVRRGRPRRLLRRTGGSRCGPRSAAPRHLPGVDDDAGVRRGRRSRLPR